MTASRTPEPLTEHEAMLHAVGCAAAVAGRTSPNPAVGAVILGRDGTLIAAGATQPYGEAHAEVVALQAAGDRAKGATAVVTLEPCNHLGRTGPCTEALIAAGISKVVYAVDDPNPIASGGAQRLRDAGVTVVVGVGYNEVVRGALKPWLHAVAHSRPFVTWKFAGTLDGRAAAADGSSQWISNVQSRRDAHRLRDRVDAIVVGSGTVLADNPSLTVRGLDPAAPEALAARQPLRAVMDRRRRVPQSAQLFDHAAETVLLDTAVPRFALKALFDRGVRHVLLEGGPTLAGAFLEARLIDEVVAYIAPRLLGAGSSVLGDAGITTMADIVTLDVIEVTQLGADVKIVAAPVFGERRED